jgi:hypothetical protein
MGSGSIYEICLCSFDLENQFELDAHVERELGGAEGQARVTSRFAENLNEQVRGAVDDSRLLGEAFGGGDMAGHPHDPLDLIQAPEFLFGDSERI